MKKSKTKLTLMNLKVSSKDRAALIAQANRFANGNVSEWLRSAGKSYKPSKRRQAA